MSTERVTVTLPTETVLAIDRRERNRSKFILDAVRRELERRQREELLRSLAEPHAETDELARLGLGDWSSHLPQDDAGELVDLEGGRTVSWNPGEGWTEVNDATGSRNSSAHRARSPAGPRAARSPARHRRERS